MALKQIAPIILPLDIAHRATRAAIEKVQEIGVPYTLTVLDGAGIVVHVTRMDGAALASVDTSIAKARTAVYFGAATKDLAGAVGDGAPMATVQTSTTAHLAFVSGGVPIMDADGVVIGGFGAGGGTPDQDGQVAEAAVAALRS